MLADDLLNDADDGEGDRVQPSWWVARMFSHHSQVLFRIGALQPDKVDRLQGSWQHQSSQNGKAPEVISFVEQVTNGRNSHDQLKDW